MKNRLHLALAFVFVLAALGACNLATPTETPAAAPTPAPAPTPPPPAPVKEPVANFSWRSYVTPDGRYVVEFSNLSENASSYEWLFGDGVTSTQVNPSHEYHRSGTYPVRLTAKSKDGEKQSTLERSVAVY